MSVYITAEEYLEAERQVDSKNEYRGGRVYPMVRSPRHCLIELGNVQDFAGADSLPG